MTIAPTVRVRSWGRVADTRSPVADPAFIDDVLKVTTCSPRLAFGLGRSYGDVCLNDGGTLVRMPLLDRIASADWQTGTVRVEAGISIGDLLAVTVPHGWFVPVSPGTKFVTLGGAIANDVHGKNHAEAGTIGCHVRALGLLRQGQVLDIGSGEHPDLFAATIGGLGLTGIILWVELQLQRIASSDFEAETHRLGGLDDFFRLAETSGPWPYTVAWVDCLATGAALGRGLFSRGRHAETGPLRVHATRPRIGVPTDAPAGLLGPTAVRLFNALYARQPRSQAARRVPYDAFLYPLDGIGHWNRLYGRLGFFQHQSVIPMASAHRTLERLLQATAAAGQGSFLVVLKLFGARRSPGLLSFPHEGATFALDLPNRGEATLELLRRMADIVVKEGGRLYPAKDASMTGEQFRAGYPNWRQLEAARDPGINSDFWRRVTRDAA